MSQKPTNIVFHCSASRFGDVGVIRKWHEARGWRDIGYHFVILNGRRIPVEGMPLLDDGFGDGGYLAKDDGLIEAGRPLNQDGLLDSWEYGAHALGFNDKSIGVCFVGNRYFTSNQILVGVTFLSLLAEWFDIPTEAIIGHRETGANKTCPTMNEGLIRAWIAGYRLTLTERVSPWDLVGVPVP